MLQATDPVQSRFPVSLPMRKEKLAEAIENLNITIKKNNLQTQLTFNDDNTLAKVTLEATFAHSKKKPVKVHTFILPIDAEEACYNEKTLCHICMTRINKVSEQIASIGISLDAITQKELEKMINAKKWEKIFYFEILPSIIINSAHAVSKDIANDINIILKNYIQEKWASQKEREITELRTDLLISQMQLVNNDLDKILYLLDVLNKSEESKSDAEIQAHAQEINLELKKQYCMMFEQQFGQ